MEGTTIDQTEVRQAARQVAGQTKNVLSKQIDERSTSFGEQIAGTARALRSIGEQLEANGPAGEAAARLATVGADYIAGIGGYLQDADMDRLIADLETFARRRPWALAGSALMLGFAASRMLQSSSVQRYRAGSNG